MMKGFSGRKFSQREDEFAIFLDLIRTERVSSYLEIGARDGDSFHSVMSALPAGSFGLAVDLPEGPWGRKSSREYLKRARFDLRRKGYRCQVVFADSHAYATVALVQQHAPFDLLLIDGDHTLAGVQGDWLNYGPMARIVAFHDIDGAGHVAQSGELIEVPKLWSELSRRFPSKEIIGRRRGMGIGVLWR
jgi:hypothetical protein